MIFSKVLLNKYQKNLNLQLIFVNLLHPLFLHNKNSTQNGSKKLQFDTGISFLLKIRINVYYQYLKFLNAAYQKVHLGLLESFL